MWDEQEGSYFSIVHLMPQINAVGSMPALLENVQPFCWKMCNKKVVFGQQNVRNAGLFVFFCEAFVSGQVLLSNFLKRLSLLSVRANLPSYYL